MHPRFHVRIFAEQDAEVLTELLHVAYAPLGAAGMNFTAVDQDWHTTLARATAGQCWVVHDDQRMVGSLTISSPPSTDLQQLTPEARVPRRAWLNQVAVDPAHQGTGIAAHLWRTGLGWAADTGATSIGVDTASPAAHLVDLYRRWGFHHRGLIHWPGKTYDSVVMTRAIPAGPTST